MLIKRTPPAEGWLGRGRGGGGWRGLRGALSGAAECRNKVSTQCPLLLPPLVLVVLLPSLCKQLSSTSIHILARGLVVRPPELYLCTF